ncbi:MAG TPA: hypothetical protein VFE32_04170 [Puia sp.]|jgi:hypothetical protein|nr:hypothetical protein [Puia sp.]
MSAKLLLSAQELRLVTDPAWILTKNSIVRKVVEMFSGLCDEWREMLDSPTEPKISRGEQYKGLPWVMLDYPRVFGKEDVMAVRTMFWWGHGFSVTLHLKGEFLRTYLPVILDRRAALEDAGFMPGTAEDEWEHEHTPGTWEDMGTRPFLKLSVNVGFDKWNKAPEILTEKFTALVQILVANR